jgi:hypothetical protein
VLKVKFLEDYPGTALVQMRTADQVDSCIRYLNGESIFTTVLVIKQSTLSEVNGDDRTLRQYDDSCSYRNFERHPHLQFLRSNASKNWMVAPFEGMIIN